MITPEERAKILNWSPISGTYDTLVDRESAYELLKSKAERATAAAEAARTAEEQAAAAAAFQKEQEKLRKQQEKEDAARKKAGTSSGDIIGDLAESTRALVRVATWAGAWSADYWEPLREQAIDHRPDVAWTA